MNKAPVSTVGIVGVSGYSGIELARIVAGHPGLALALAVSDKWAGTTLGEHLAATAATAGSAGGRAPEGSDARRHSPGSTSCFCARPPRRRSRSRPSRSRRARASSTCPGAFRLAANEYPRWYGFTHARPDLLAVGLLLDARGGRAGRDPRGAAGVEPRAATPRPSRWPCWRCCAARSSRTTASSSTPPAGRPAPAARPARTSGSPRSTATSAPTGCSRHQHTPEIERALALAGQPPLKVTFTPHLLPTRRGILATVVRPPEPRQDGRRRGGGDRSLRGGQAVPARRRRRRSACTRWSARTACCSARDADPERGVALAFAAIDNLVRAPPDRRCRTPT